MMSESERHPYSRRAYAQSLSHLGEAFDVPEWHTHVLRRSLPSGESDWAGCYPVAILGGGADLPAGALRLKREGGVSVTLVSQQLAALADIADVARPFKRHYIHDNRLGPPSFSRHHRYEIRRASEKVDIQIIQLVDYMPQWMALYGALADRHGLDSTAMFPEQAFQQLAELEGLTAIGAFVGAALVSCHLWIGDGRSVYSHLAASNEEGYGRNASYAIYDAALQHFKDADTINFGGGAGVVDDPESGLARFKRGFANDDMQYYLYGVVLDPDRYDAMSRGVTSDYFPAYRDSGALKRE